MRQVLISAIVAAVVTGLVLTLEDVLEREDDALDIAASPPPAPAPAPSNAAGIVLSVTDALTEDTWVNAARTSGADRRVLTDPSNSICYLTRVQIRGVQGPEDSNTCVIEIDDFTGYWALVATVEEGGASEVRCNARCLVWDEEITQ
ncbi:MAG TPA: hypothetical protein VKQ06_01715 [Gammaproteobacteria bacterium]|nr:hypothetical protein [Gammaproteobacteria bacterium]